MLHMHDKKKVLLKGIGIHILTYLAISLILTGLGVPFFVVFLVFMMLVWGLLVLSYAYYFHK